MSDSRPVALPFMARLLTLARQNPDQLRWIAAVVGVFLLIYFLPAGAERFDNAVLEGVRLTHWYAQEHVILCLLPAFLIAGAMAAYLSQGAVMRYLGPSAPKPVAFGMASVSGMLLAVCSCTVLPLFGGIYRRGAGLGPAVAFLYSGPAINVMAVVVTAKVLGPELGLARAVGAILFAVVIGLIMHLIYRREERERRPSGARGFGGDDDGRPLGQVTAFFGLMVGILVFANWAAADSATWMAVYAWKWPITAALGGLFALLLIRRWGWPPRQVAGLAGAVTLASLLAPGVPELAFAVGIVGLMLVATLRDDDREWARQSWDFTRQIVPLLLAGVFIAGLLLGRPGEEGLIPSDWVALAVGDNGFRSTFLASLLGGFMYFSTLTEVPIVQGLIGNGMGKGPALALLLAGPALSLPNMLVIRTILGTGKTLVYCALVVVMATLSGYLYGQLWP
ncbi:permease [Halomonas getboli]|uniref:permease n=1 Tax=Halomonas getboli TaxID=2935862 RepID=UPI001FFFE2C5|nr:permease [Halomonas getboli]MCK2183565.1 permease [Halomonas getboli]